MGKKFCKCDQLRREIILYREIWSYMSGLKPEYSNAEKIDCGDKLRWQEELGILKESSRRLDTQISISNAREEARKRSQEMKLMEDNRAKQEIVTFSKIMTLAQLCYLVQEADMNYNGFFSMGLHSTAKENAMCPGEKAVLLDVLSTMAKEGAKGSEFAKLQIAFPFESVPKAANAKGMALDSVETQEFKDYWKNVLVGLDEFKEFPKRAPTVDDMFILFRIVARQNKDQNFGCSQLENEHCCPGLCQNCAEKNLKALEHGDMTLYTRSKYGPVVDQCSATA